MPRRGRDIAVALIVLALLLAAGRWIAEFLTDRFWETAAGDRVAAAGTRRALLGVALELSILALVCAWFFGHLLVAAGIALPQQPPPDRMNAKRWPAQLPRWTLAVVALVLGGLLGTGGAKWLDPLLLSLDGVRFGTPDPLLGADLGRFVRQFPLWLALQQKALVLVVATLIAVLLLHVAGETVRIKKRGLWVWPRARGQIALLLGLLALVLGWAAVLEPVRLAAGLRGPLTSSEFVLRNLLSRIQLALALSVALVSVLWWLRGRTWPMVAFWLFFLASLGFGRALPFHPATAAEDPSWRSAARALDSVAFQLRGLEERAPAGPPAASALRPTLWDDSLLANASSDSGRRATLSSPERGWLPIPPLGQPVWFTVRELTGQPPALLALSDDRVSPSGGLLSWQPNDTMPSPELDAYRRLGSGSIQPLAPRVALTREGAGIPPGGWVKQIILAWALQTRQVFSADSGMRVAWQLDPASRLRIAAPFAEWSPPRPRFAGGSLVWQSDGLLSSDLFPSSARIARQTGTISMLRSSFLGMVEAESGKVRIFRRDPADSLAAAWARITAPLIEEPQSIPAELRDHDPYPQELLVVQAQVLEGTPWKIGRLERRPDGRQLLTPPAPGGAEHVVPYLRPNTPDVGAFLVARRTPSGDSLRLIRLDSLWMVESSATLNHRWEIFPFQQAMRDSVLAAGGSYVPGQVRYALASDGILAYQPAWSVSPSGRAQLVLVNVALGRPNHADRMSLGAGRTVAEAWMNFRGEPTPIAAGSGAQAILEQARRLMLHADSALKRGEWQELGRTLAYLRDLLGPRRP